MIRENDREGEHDMRGKGNSVASMCGHCSQHFL